LYQAKYITLLHLPRVGFCKANNGRFKCTVRGIVESIVYRWAVMHLNVTTYCMHDMAKFGCVVHVSNPE